LAAPRSVWELRPPPPILHPAIRPDDWEVSSFDEVTDPTMVEGASTTALAVKVTAVGVVSLLDAVTV
jgi:hypothetical protein